MASNSTPLSCERSKVTASRYCAPSRGSTSSTVARLFAWMLADVFEKNWFDSATRSSSSSPTCER
jgi:hypothetical protein